jgi:hypothetical protein
VTETTVTAERRGTGVADRRKNSRSGRRASDPHVNWRRVAWLFAAYAAYLSIRSWPESLRAAMSTLRRWFTRTPTGA